MKKFICTLLTAAFLGSILIFPVLAGGWAVITIEDLPGHIAANAPFTVQFAVRQHGRTLLPGLEPTITFTLPQTMEGVKFSAAPIEGQPGMYKAEILLPQPGAWEWSIQAFTMDQPMPDLVVAPGNASTMVKPGNLSGVATNLASLAFVILLAAGLLFAVTRRLKMVIGSGYHWPADWRRKHRLCLQPHREFDVQCTGFCEFGSGILWQRAFHFQGLYRLSQAQWY